MKIFNSIQINILLLFLFTSIAYGADKHIYPQGTNPNDIPYSSYLIYTNGDTLTTYINNNSSSGDYIVFHSGTFTDLTFTINTAGLKIKAGIAGQTMFTGQTQILIRANYTNLSGIIFQNIKYDNFKPAIGIVNSLYRQITNCAFDEVGYLNNPGAGQFAYGIIHLYDDVRFLEINHCHWIASRTNSINVYWNPANGFKNTEMHIHHNHFENITFADGVNGNEAILLGRGLVGSEHYYMDGIIEYNLFDDCNADSEIISDKASRNTIRYNTFRQSGNSTANDPALSLRYGKNSNVYGNFFIGTDRGIIIYGYSHNIYNNYIESDKYGIELPGGDSSTTHPNSHHCQIYNNTIVNADTRIKIGKNGFDKPGTDNYFKNNLVYKNNSGNLLKENSSGDASNINWDGNLFRAENPATLAFTPDSGYITNDPKLTFADPAGYINGVGIQNPHNLWRPTTGSSVINNGVDIIGLSEDIDKQWRDSNNLDIGADEFSSLTKYNEPFESTDTDIGTSYSLSKQNTTSVVNEVRYDFRLNNNYPNPFNPGTIITYQLSDKSNVYLSVYDILGREVTVLVNENQEAGSYSVEFNSLNYTLLSGIYFYKLNAGKYSDVKKMIMLK